MAGFSKALCIAKATYVVCAILFALQASWAQNATDPAAGINPFSTQVSGPIDSVDIATGNILLRVPVRTKIGALPVSYSLVSNSHAYTYSYSSKGKTFYLMQVSKGFKGEFSNLFGGSLQYAPTGVNLECGGGGPDPEYAWYVVDSTGAKHLLNATTDANGCLSLPSGAVTEDASGYTANFTSPTSASVYDKQGNETPASTLNEMVDPDGNMMTGAYSTSNGQAVWSYNDTLIPSGTPYVITSSTGADATLPDTYQYTDAAGGTQSVKVNYSLYNTQTNFACGSYVDLGGQGYLPSSITLADGGSYTFTYETTPGSQYQGTGDITGRVAKITFPSGGYVSYTYGGSNNGINCANSTVPILTRTVSDNNGNVSTWTYNNGTVTDPANNQTVYTFAGTQSLGWFQTSASYYQGTATGTPLKAVATCYNGTAYPCTSFVPQPNSYIYQKDEYTSLNGSATSWIETKYDQFGNTTEVKSYNASGTWGSGATTTLVSDKTIYYGQSWNGSSCTAYSSGYIRDTPCYTQVTNGSGTLMAKTQITYSSTGHPTTTQKWISGTSPVVWSTTSATYNTNGTVATATDANNNQTTFNYNGSCNSMVVTSTTLPTVNGVTLSTSKTWDCNGGVVSSSTDANGNGTNYSYIVPTSGLGDPLYRQTQVTYPDNGSTTTTYNTGTTLPWSISTSTSITSSINLKKTTVYDGLSRDVQVQLTSDPSGTDFVDTTYDLLGRKSSVSNPHRSSSATTDGTTSFTYDALNRVLIQTQPDTSKIQTSYNGLCTTVTDEAGQSRKNCTDGLGRMTGVWEDPSHADYETDYVYDALNNLQTVTQKGGSSSGNWRTRSFVYDGLSRLTSATNPESGAIQYTYDGNSNLLTKVALSPNQPSTGTATVTTTYTYDALNRLTKKSYSDTYSNNSPTPSSSYGYDAVSLTGCTINPPGATDSNPLGEETSMCDGSGGTNWTHDVMGRVLTERRDIGKTSVNHYVDYTYNRDGSLATLVTPPLKQLNYTYSGAGRVTQLVDSTDGINFAQTALYAPAGELTSTTLGSATGFSGFSVSNAYSDRLQPILMSATNSSTSATVFSECFDFHLGVAVSTSPCSFSASAAGDNGNIYTIVNNRDNTRTQSFGYDNLNRIVSGESNGSQWGETFTTDAWGNLTNKAGISGKTYGETVNAPVLTNNQVSGLGYDAAGNMISNGSISYVYDAENRLIWTSGYRYIYDGAGERVEKCQAASATTACPTSGTTGTLYWKGTGSTPLAETDLGGNLEEEYLFLNGDRIARRDVTSTGTTIAVHYYFSDHLGSHGVIYSATGTTCEQDIDYYPYGGQEQDYCSGSGVSQNYKFTGKERDSESGLDNFGARYNSSFLGRFMTADWAAKPTTVPYAKFGDPQTLNLYSYVENGPLNRIDTNGHNFATPMLMARVDQNDYDQWSAGQSMNSASNGHTDQGQTAPAATQQSQQSKPDQAQKQGKTTGSDKPWDFRKNVVDLLRDQNSCSDWFNTATGSAADIMSNVPILTFDPKSPRPVDDANTGDGSKTPINVNSKGRFYSDSDNQLLVGDKYKPGSYGARMTILLHELAHKMQLIPSDGTSLYPNIGQSERNTQQVMDHCGAMIDVRALTTP